MLVALEKLGTYGNDASIGKIARAFRCSGKKHYYVYFFDLTDVIFIKGSVMNFTRRFITAILSLEDEVLFWPEKDERIEISNRIKQQTYFPNCVGFFGFVDGALIPLSTKPCGHSEDFYIRKSNYAINAMIVCDDLKVIRHCYVGWPGNTHDNRVYDNSMLAKSPSDFFSGDQYILADSAYTASREVVPAYKKPAGGQVLGVNK